MGRHKKANHSPKGDQRLLDSHFLLAASSLVSHVCTPREQLRGETWDID